MALEKNINETESGTGGGAPDRRDAGIDTMTGSVRSEGIEHLDFISAIVLMVLCVFSSVLALSYYVKSGKEFYASPGFMPMIIGVILFILSVSLLTQSLKGSSAKERFGQAAAALRRGTGSRRFFNSITGLAMFGVYIYVLLRFLPFWLASLILLMAVFIYLKASGIVKCIIIASLSIGGIVLLFQIAFRVPMP
jgi:hypothetical protein